LGHPTPARHTAWSPAPALRKEHRAGFPRSEYPFVMALGWCFTAPAVGAGVRRVSFEWLLHTCVLGSLKPFPFGSCLSAKFGKLRITTLQPHLHSSLSIATCLGRWRLLASRLSPFPPASDPRLPVARQGKVLSLHHLEGKDFTYMNTQLSRFSDLAAHPLYLAIQFRANGSHTQHSQNGLWQGYVAVFASLSMTNVDRFPFSIDIFDPQVRSFSNP
jgi:hypothetical protein